MKASPAIKDFVLERLDRLDRFSELSKEVHVVAVGGKEPARRGSHCFGQRDPEPRRRFPLTTYTRRLKEPLKKWRKIRRSTIRSEEKRKLGFTCCRSRMRPSAG